MSTSLPERPHLDQLRHQAKELRDAARAGDASAAGRVARHLPAADPSTVSLAAAQLVIARELGFSSWPRLKAAVDATLTAADRERALVAAALEGRLRESAELLESEPGVASRSLRAAAVLGDPDVVGEEVLAHPEAALAVDDERGWPPLLYACYSRWHQIDPARATRLAEVVRLLLRAGADPNTNNGAFPQGYRSALRGAVEVDNPGIVEILLECGADPDDSRCIEQAAGHKDPRCLGLLLDHGARVAGTWAIGIHRGADRPRAVSLLVDALLAGGGDVASAATNGLADAAAARASSEVVGVLLAAGADANVRDSDMGLSALRGAVRAGDEAVAALLAGYGATDDSTDVDRLLGALRKADGGLARQLVAEQPDLPDRLLDQDRAALIDAAGSASPASVELMLEWGLSVHDRDESGEQPLHGAAYLGNAAVVRVLLDAGADVDGRDRRFGGTPLAFATVGSGEQAGRAGDWVGTVRMLLEAGASREGVWVVEKPPNDEVGDVLLEHGIGPDDSDERDGPSDSDDLSTPDVETEVAGSIGTGAMADIARHLEAAYRDSDLDLLGSLLHPRARWTGVCQDRAQVLDWYRGLQNQGIVATVESVEVDRDAVVLGLSLARPAVGVRPPPAQRVWQVFAVDDGGIIDIRVYPDRKRALARS